MTSCKTSKEAAQVDRQDEPATQLIPVTVTFRVLAAGGRGAAGCASFANRTPLLSDSTCCQCWPSHAFVFEPDDPADEVSLKAACPALPRTPPFLLRTPRRADALLIRCILTSQVLHLQATLSSGRVLLGAGFGKADSIFSCKIRCAAALSASNPVPLPRAPACSLHAFLKPLSPDCLG